jgi:hypothetical protein
MRSRDLFQVPLRTIEQARDDLARSLRELPPNDPRRPELERMLETLEREIAIRRRPAP